MPDWQLMGSVRRRQAVTLDSNGNGMVQFAVPSSNHKWVLDDMIVATDQAQTTAPYPQVIANLGGQQAGTSEGASWLGNQVTMRGPVEMDAGLDLIVQLVGGVAGSNATVIIEGSTYLWR